MVAADWSEAAQADRTSLVLRGWATGMSPAMTVMGAVEAAGQ